MLRESGHPIVAMGLDVAMAGLRPVRKRLVPWATGRTLEIGCGTGANFPYYRDQADVVAIEPDPHMRKRASSVADNLHLDVQIVACGADSLPFDDDHFDTVVATFVLCTIPNPVRAVEEIKRVLRPDGRLLFAEHVLASANIAQKVQRNVTPLWSHMAGGCRLDNDAISQYQHAGFSLELLSKPVPRYHLFPVVYGVGKKGSFRAAEPF